MTAPMVIEKNVIIDTLIGLEDPDNPGVFPIRELFELEGSPDEYKIFWEHADGDAELPYIVVSHFTGSIEQTHLYSDTIYKVVATTADISKAEPIANAIHLLHHAEPDTTAYDGVCPVTYFAEIMPIFDRYQLQSIPLFMVGGLYRLQLKLGS